MTRVAIPVFGLACGGGGGGRLELALTRLPGVQTAYVNPATDTAYVAYDPGEVEVEALLDEVRRIGYRPGPVTDYSNLGSVGRKPG